MPRRPTARLAEAAVADPLRAQQRCGLAAAEAHQAPGDPDVVGATHRRGQRGGEVGARHRLVVDDVVDPGGDGQGGHDRRRGVVHVDHRHVPAGRPGPVGQPPAGHPQERLGVVDAGAVEHAEAQRHARAAGRGHPGGVGLGHQGRRRVGRGGGLDGGGVDPAVAAVGVEEHDRLLHEPPGAGGEGGVDEVGGRRPPQPVVLGPAGRPARRPDRGQVRGQVDHGVVAVDGLAHGRGVEQVDLARGGPGGLDLGPLGRAAGQRRHLVARVHQPGDRRSADGTGRPGHEDPHGLGLSHRRIPCV